MRRKLLSDIGAIGIIQAGVPLKEGGLPSKTSGGSLEKVGGAIKVTLLLLLCQYACSVRQIAQRLFLLFGGVGNHLKVLDHQGPLRSEFALYICDVRPPLSSPSAL
ncbi:hypothetical protein OUZ56_007464 [Daphnia magna]|uniref:Uncharacterized protein n=1 Tax=Daphnia magna TaxID=35525 RepID=A0ABR0AA21_9CRUS|nr:hypothetical protein OUZ56_007464 [Daphnia magna]